MYESTQKIIQDVTAKQLIDKKELIRDAYSLIDEDESRDHIPQIIEDYANALDEIKAIPIAWIEAWIFNHPFCSPKDMLIDWHIEETLYE